MKLLDKGLKYNLHYRHKDWIKTSAIDAAISKIHERDQKYETNSSKQHPESQERHLINNIKKKINQNQLIATKADKGNTLVILHKDDYKNKIEEFITQNDFTKLPHDITNKQQRNIRSSINNNNNKQKQQMEIQ
jgi:hypothetical protein